MSVISDALKQAQKEKSRRAGQPAAAVADSFFPYPARQKSRGTNVAIGVVGGLLLLVVAGAAVVRLRATPPVRPTTRAVAAAPVAAVVTPSSSVVSPPADSAPPTVATLPKSSSAGVPTIVKQVVQPERAPVAQQAPPPASRPATQPAADSSAVDAVHIVVNPQPARLADSLFNEAYTQQLRNNVDGAIALYERAIALPSAPSGAFNNYGALLRQRGNAAAATEMFQLALQHDDKNVPAWINLGDSYDAAGHHSEAVSAFARALQLDPWSGAVKIRLASEYLAIGDTAGARRTYDEAVKAAPRDPSAHYGYGMFLQQQRDYRGAIREYQGFVDFAGDKYDTRTVDDVKRHIALLRRYAP